MKSKNLKYISGIDGLRALAVLSVIIYHFKSSLLPGGFVGVDIFFVISGYVVSSSLSNMQSTGIWNLLLKFYARRIVRIYPALLFMLIIVGLLQTLFIPQSWLISGANHTATLAFFGLSNFALIWFVDGYFSPTVEYNAFTHTWSLAIEEQFYLIFPVIFFLWIKYKNINLGTQKIFYIVLGSTIFTSLIFSIYETQSKPDHAFYLLPSRFWELGAGAALFVAHSKHRLVALTGIIKSTCILFGVVIIGIALAFADTKLFPFPWAVIPVVGTLLTIIGVSSKLNNKLIIDNLLENPLVIIIGKMSYSLYLWHWPVLVIFRWTVGLEGFYTQISAVIIIIFTSLISYYAIEKPFRNGTLTLSNSDGYIFSRGVITIIVCSVFTVGILMSRPYLSLSVTKDKAIWYSEAKSEYETLNKSTFLATNQKHKVFALGDSHTKAYSVLFEQLYNSDKIFIQKYWIPGCSAANLLRPVEKACAEAISQSVQEIKSMSVPGDIVFLSSLRMNRLGDQWKTFEYTTIESRQKGSEFIREQQLALVEADLLVSSLENAGLKVIMDAPKPVFKSPPFRCSDWFNSNNPVCEGGLSINKSFLIAHRQPVMDSIEKLLVKHPNLIIYDAFPLLCPKNVCNTHINGLPAFFDGDHLSGYGNNFLYPSFKSTLMKVF